MLERACVVVLVAGLAAAQVVFPKDEAGAASSDGPGEKSLPIFFPREAKQPEVPCTTYEGKQGSCRLLLKCATFYAEIAQLSRSPCTINEHQQGVCCPATEAPVTDVGGLISKQPVPQADVQVPDIKFTEINNACEMGIQAVDQQDQFEAFLVQNKVVAKKGSSMAQHGMLFQTTEEVVKKGKDASKNIAASVILMKQFKLSKEQGGFALPQFGIQNTVIQDTCPEEPICPDTKYRVMNATCNNRRNKSWGQAETAFQRILPPAYDDGLNAPRSKTKSGNPLPSPRAISSEVIIDRDNLYDNFTLLIMQWGQFLDHDITHTPLTKVINNSTGEMEDITCCNRGAFRDASTLHQACMPIDIPETDAFYSKHNQRCMDFARSLPAPRPACNLGAREQMNQITAFLDASNVYGSSVKESNELRAFSGGLLKENNAQQHLLPPDSSSCQDATKTMHCFKAGDSRVNEQPQLAVMHTLWMRQHNRLARGLSAINPGWTDEILFQEARRIVAAQMQHITYNEYLPIVLGSKFMVAFGLVPRESGYAPGYREDIDPSINNVFATAAFRYGHTLISGSMKSFSKFGTLEQDLKLSENQFSPFALYRPGGFDALLRGVTKQPSQKFDHFFSEQLTNHLFPAKMPDGGFSPFGMDLVALNIQRGRDHGLPDYNQWRKICGLPLATTFQDLTDVIDLDVIQHLQALYEDVNDIDIFIGGISERPMEGSLLGHTFLCIVGDQFARLRLGDRFFYENGGLESSFREEQLDEIRRTSLARIMCDNSDVEMMQPLVFIRAHLLNKRVPCASDKDIPKVSLQPWRNEPVWA